MKQKVQQAGEKAVAQGTPVHAIKKKLRLTSSSSLNAQGE